MDRYYYNGPVRMFDQCVSNHWEGETMAVSKKKAKSNLAYQYKKSHNLSSDVKIVLTGDVTIIE